VQQEMLCFAFMVDLSCSIFCQACKAKANAEADKQRMTDSRTAEALNQAQHACPAHFILLCAAV